MRSKAAVILLCSGLLLAREAFAMTPYISCTSTAFGPPEYGCVDVSCEGVFGPDGGQQQFCAWGSITCKDIEPVSSEVCIDLKALVAPAPDDHLHFQNFTAAGTWHFSIGDQTIATIAPGDEFTFTGSSTTPAISFEVSYPPNVQPAPGDSIVYQRIRATDDLAGYRWVIDLSGQTCGRPCAYTYAGQSDGSRLLVSSRTLDRLTVPFTGTIEGDTTTSDPPPTIVANAGSGAFGPRTDFAAGTQPFCAAIADLNGDGNPDLVTANLTSNDLSVRLGNGAGGFGAKTSFPTGLGPLVVAIGDLNLDGIPDFAVTNSGSATVSVMIGNGAGGIGARVDYPTGASPWTVAIADLNHDGKPDLVVTNYGPSSNSVSVLLGNGLGGFGPKTDYAVGVNPVSVAIGDLNEDGNPDLVVANWSGASVSVLLGNGLGGFGAATPYATGGRPISASLVDLNGDHHLDLVVADWSNGAIKVLLGSGTGALGAATSFATVANPYSVAVGDVNGDGKPDVVVGSNTVPSVSVLPGNGSGGFGPKTDLATGAVPVSVALADVNNDGCADLATANRDDNTASLLLGVGGSIVPAGRTTLPPGWQRSYAITPAPGYAVGNVWVDGVAQGPITSYTFTNVTGNHEIEARFTLATTAVPDQTPPSFALEGVRPTPIRGNDLEVTFSLPTSSSARLELIEVSGRRVVVQDVGSLGVGPHTVKLATHQRIAPGVYWVRLVQGVYQRTVPVVVLE